MSRERRLRRSARAVALAACAALVAACATVAGAQVSPPLPTSQDRPATPAETPAPAPAPITRDEATALAARAADRIKALQRESDQLAAQQRSVLTQLRQLEVTRALRAEELAAVSARLEAVTAKVTASAARVAELEAQRVARTPALEGRLEALYKRGGADGYVRLLLATAEGRDLARASRGVVALARVEELRIAAHRKLLAEERAARDQLASEQRQVVRLRT
ncbi:MAG: hypothetical protein JNL48_11625, partial [Acidobacteria bacterium]|nr:hypothetical protein [Acidobacteriota bacterium]